MNDRDNERRLQLASEDPVSTNVVASGGLKSKLDLAFAAPTLFVELPSKGKFYKPGSPLHGKETLEIKFMTAKEEDILTSRNLLKKGIVIDKLIQSLVVDKNINTDTLTIKALIKKGVVLDRLLESVLVDKSISVNDLLVGDRNALLIDSRISGFGSKYLTSVSCPACNTVAKHSFLLDENKKLADGSIPEHLCDKVKHIEGKLFSITLPQTGVNIHIRLMDGNDEKAIVQITEANKNATIDSSNTQQLKLLIDSAEGEKDKKLISQFIDVMPVRDSRFLKEAYKAITPNVDLTQQFECKACEYSADMEVPFNLEFFWFK